MAAPTSTDNVTVRKLASTLNAYNTKLNTKFGGKTDKVAGATSGNFAALDSSGNLTDSGKNATDFDAAVADLSAHTSNSSIHVTSSDKTAWDAKQNAVSTDSDDNAFGDNTTIATGFGSDKVHLNLASRLWTYISGKVFSDNGKVPASNIPDSVKDKIVFIDGTITSSGGSYSVSCNTTYAQVAAMVDPSVGKYPVCRFTLGIQTYYFAFHMGVPTSSSQPRYTFGSTDVYSGISTVSFMTSVYVEPDDVWKFREITYDPTSWNNDLAEKSSTSHTHSVKINGTTKTIAASGGTAVDLGTYLTQHQDISGKLDTTGNASNTTSTFTKASGDTSSMASGSKLSALFTAISSLFASLKALAFKDKVSTGDIGDDAITADKVKDNETLPVNVSGNAGSAKTLPRGYAAFNNTTTGYKKIAELDVPASSNDNIAVFEVYETEANVAYNSRKGLLTTRIRNNSTYYQYAADFTAEGTFRHTTLSVRSDPSTGKLIVFAEKSDSSYCGLYIILVGAGGWRGEYYNDRVTLFNNSNIESVSGFPEVSITTIRRVTASTNGVGSPATPVYVAPDGQVQPCDPSQMTAGDVASQSKLNTVGYVRSILYRKSANFDIPLTGLREGDLVIVFCTKSSGSITVTYGGSQGVVGATTVAAGRFRMYCYVNASTGLIASES